MARPVVLVYQEYATTTVTPETPDLNCLLVGPCYWIKDYLDDKGEQKDGGIRVSSDYGVKDASYPHTGTPPAPGTDAITVAEPPSNKIGALLDPESVVVYFDACRVLIGADEGTGVDVIAGVPHNKITVPGGSPLVLTAIKAGDYVIIQDPANPGVLPSNPDLVKRVQSVDVPGRIIYTTTNFSVQHTALKMRIEREVNDVLIDASYLYITGNTVKVQGGVQTLLTGESTPRDVYFAQVYMQYRSLRQDLRMLDTVSSTTDVTTKLGKVDARNPLAGCATTALANTITPIQFFGVKSNDSAGHTECLDIIGGRKDVYATVPLTTEKGILTTYKTKYEQLASIIHAETTGIPQKFRVVLGSQALPLTKIVSPADGTAYVDGMHKSVDGASPGTDGGIAIADDINVFVDPDGTFLSAGVRAGDTLVIALDAAGTSRVGSYTVAQVYDNHRMRLVTPFAGTNGMNGLAAYYIIRGTGTPFGVTLTGATVTLSGPPDQSVVVDKAGTASATNHAGKILRLTAPTGPDVGDWLIASAVTNAHGAWTVIDPGITMAAASGTAAGALYTPIYSVVPASAHTVTTRRCFRVIKSALAAHQTNLVIAGDALEISSPVAGPTWLFTTVFSHPIAYIPNENDLVLAANEDAEAINPAIGDTTLHFRVDRSMSKDDQVIELVSIAQSFLSRRTVLVWSDSVLVTDLIDGSKPRTVPREKAMADPQPGYYLAAVVGGLTSGLPSHQGFTNLGIANIDQVYHSTRYFSDEQLTHLSDGGWFVFVQDTPSALPYCLHQLTTDPDTLESGEYSVVKNFDFISMFFMDIMFGFLGQYNITPETLGLLNQSLIGGIDLLKLRKYAKIGAPLTNGSVVSVTQSTAAADRAEAYLTVQMPKPLNRVGLHLVSV